MRVATKSAGGSFLGDAAPVGAYKDVFLESLSTALLYNSLAGFPPSLIDCQSGQGGNLAEE